MRDNQAPRPIRLADYEPPAFLVEHTDLDFDLRATATRVVARLQLYRNPGREDRPRHCHLQGEGLTLTAVAIDDEPLAETAWEQHDAELVLFDVPDRFTLETIVELDPENNTALEGLYVSRGMYCTQCEAEGFRRITWFPDRPDVLSRFSTTIHADQSDFPVLLSNGNPVASGEEEGGRHWVRWEDPWPKPCYLFALVAGDLACLEDEFTTRSGRPVALRLYAEQRDLDKLGHAMDSLKRAMAWDEQRFGREYDLDIYMIVAVSHFNMGAMENKGLNIFNTSCVLAHPKTTTDSGFQRVESVVAHEYFHNWSGNRVTCRDWFQLSLKEGFTVFRDAEFSADMNSRSVKRIEDVAVLRAMQFPEDQGPMAHPVRPDEYFKIDNFYTITVYEKGAELVRMQHELLGEEAFRAGTDLYFQRFDGQAVTCDDFVDCMEEAGAIDLSRFRLWYSQAGTPQLRVRDHYEQGQYRLTVRQYTPPTPGQPDKRALMIPLRLALFGEQGEALALNQAGERETTLILSEEEETFVFDLAERPVPSLLRGFSAPVELDYPYSEEQKLFLLAHDDDGFCRWDAAQRLYFAALDRLLDQGTDATAEVARLQPALEQVCARAGDDPAEAALLLTVPGEAAIGDRRSAPLDPGAIHVAREGLLRALGQALAASWWQLADAMSTPGEYRAEPGAIGRRALKHRALEFLAAAGDTGIGKRLEEQFGDANNMTDEQGALRLLAARSLAGADKALEVFYRRWREEALVLDQWFAVQAAVPDEATVERVAALLEHEDFDWRLPNRVRALLGTFTAANPCAFHRPDGRGYELFTEALRQLDRLNPQVAARMANAAGRLPRLEAGRRERFHALLSAIQSQGCSQNLNEVLERILASVGKK